MIQRCVEVGFESGSHRGGGLGSQATALALNEPDEMLTGKELESFLTGIDAYNGRVFEFNCVLRRRTGRVSTGGNEFAGGLLVVHNGGKSLNSRIDTVPSRD